VASKDERPGQPGSGPVPAADAEAFAESLNRRRQAAHGLERDLLTEVPLLYGSPGGAPDGPPQGDPGIVLARVHREVLLRRNGGGIPARSGRRSDAVLPFERATVALAFLVFLFLMAGKLG
jgi:hypothetical protein